MSKPNIVFMIADDHRFDAIGARGNDEVNTPNLDGLMARGTTMTHTYIQGATSAAVCMPSRAMLLTGRPLFKACEPLERWVYAFPEHVKLLPELLRENDYHTHGVGKWHNPRQDFARCFDSGSQIFFGGMSNHDKVPVYDFDPSGIYDRDNATIGDGFSTDLFGDAAIDFLQTYSDDEPFFLYVAFTAPHDPRTPPDDHIYDASSISLPENFMPQHPFDNGEMQIRDEELARFPRTPDDVRQHIADYYGMISDLDDKIGDILQALSERDDASNTIIIYTADHGLAVGQHGLMGKQNLYDHSIRVPLIIAGPRIPENQHREALCHLYDLFPTLCELADIPVPLSNEGDSLVSLIRDAKEHHRESVFAAYQAQIETPINGKYQRMVRQGQYKLIEYFVDEVRTTQLFELENDPLEMNNLASDPAYSDVIIRLRHEMRAWQLETDDPCTDTEL